MSNQSNNHHSKTDAFKQFLKEYLWFLLLLAPLGVMPFLIVEKVSPKEKRVVKVESQKTVFTKSIEVTSAQVATIVAKPLSELIKMNVYLPSPSVAANEYYFSPSSELSNMPQILISKDRQAAYALTTQTHYSKERT